MAEYANRYDVGSLESTRRQFTDWQLVKRIIKDYMFRHKLLVIGVGFIIFLKTVFVLSGPLIYKVTLDNFINYQPQPNEQWLVNIIHGISNSITFGHVTPWSNIVSAGLVYFFVGILLWVMMSLQQYYINKLGYQMIADIRSDFFKHLEKLSQNFFEYENTGKLVSRVTNDAEAMRTLVSSGMIGIVADLLTATSILMTMFILNLQLALVSIVLAPLLAVITRTLNRIVRDRWRIARLSIASMTAKVQDLMYGAKVTKAMAQEDRSLREFNEVNEMNSKAQINAELTANIYEATVGFFTALISSLIWFIGGRQVIQSTCSLGDLVAFVQYSDSFLTPVNNISTFYGGIQQALAGAERIFKVLDIKPEVNEAIDAVDFPSGEGVLELKDANFSYIKGQLILKNINIRTIPGERLAIFGPTGSGKSSIINLIGRFYDTDSGEVLIDNIDIKKIKLKSLRHSISIVLQEPYLFHGTLKYNLKFGLPDVSDEEMIRISKLVGIHNPIIKLEKGYDEEVQERGSNLSYGQRQLVCLARAIISNPKILILDEATSSVDPYTEQLIHDALKAEISNRTILIVTHRVSTVRDADRIIILNNGEVQGEGTHTQLITNNDLYRRLCEMQLIKTL